MRTAPRPRQVRVRLRAVHAACTAILTIATTACGAGTPPTAEMRRPAASIPADAVDASSRDTGSDAAPSWISLDDVAARAPSVAAGMREEKRQELDARGSLTTELVRAPSADLCVRVSLVTTKPVHAWLEDIRGSQLADGGTGARLLLASRGPVCVRKGDAVVLRVEGREPFTLRAVVWASP